MNRLETTDKPADMLAALDEAFGLEQLNERWKPYGYTVETAMQAKAAYEEWAKEELHFDRLDDAVCGTNETGGDFPIRLEAFFAGWISSANDHSAGDDCIQCDNSGRLMPDGDQCEWCYREPNSKFNKHNA
jgi:hypothetical protein